VPPQNLEAEESVWAAILLRPRCPSGASPTWLAVGAFSLNATARIYRTALMLHRPGQGPPPTSTAMAAWAGDTGQLEKVGGKQPAGGAGGAQLLKHASIDQVARLVMEQIPSKAAAEIRSGGPPPQKNEVIRFGL